MTVEQIAGLPVHLVANDSCVLLLWTTWPFIRDALRVLDAWGFEYVTGLPWVKVVSLERAETPAFDLDGDGGAARLKPTYGVGYWMRGCTEPILLAKRPGAPSVRTPWVGLVSENARHSRKPDTLYDLAESFPAPRLELFARRVRAGWTQLGDGLPEPTSVPDGLDALAGKLSQSEMFA